LPDGSEAEVPWLVGLRDRALIGVMVYTFARISAVVAMCLEEPKVCRLAGGGKRIRTAGPTSEST
jgi:hypothetical protein